MEASCTEQVSKKKADRPSTERVFLGRRFEELAVRACEKRSYKILKRNFRMKAGEVDILAHDPTRKRNVLVEVRGRVGMKYRPSVTISRAKIRRLKLLAKILQTQMHLPLHIELVEILKIGNTCQIKFFPITN